MSPTDPQHLPTADDRSSEAIRGQVAALFRQHYAGLVGFAVRYVKSVEVAEEVVQEVFLRVWSQCENEGDASGVTRAYLYSAARNQAVTLLRHEHPIAVPAVAFVLSLVLMPETRTISMWATDEAAEPALASPLRDPQT